MYLNFACAVFGSAWPNNLSRDISRWSLIDRCQFHHCVLLFSVFTWRLLVPPSWTFGGRLSGRYLSFLLFPYLTISQFLQQGFTTAIATLHAYLADTTTSATRSRTFSMALGLLFSGFALGPTFGGLLIRFTGHTISVFYVATAVHFLYALMVWFIIPESNSPRKMQIAKAKYQEELDEYQTTQAREGASMLHALKRLFSFLSPLSVFAPTQVSDSGNPLKPPRRDWNLALIALSYAFTVSIMASATYKFQVREIPDSYELLIYTIFSLLASCSIGVQKR